MFGRSFTCNITTSNIHEMPVKFLCMQVVFGVLRKGIIEKYQNTLCCVKIIKCFIFLESNLCPLSNSLSVSIYLKYRIEQTYFK